MSYDYLIYLDICKHILHYHKTCLNTRKSYYVTDFKTKKVKEKFKIIQHTGSFSNTCSALKRSFDDVNFNEKELKLLDRICDDIGIVWSLPEEEIFNYICKFLARKDIMDYYKVSNIPT